MRAYASTAYCADVVESYSIRAAEGSVASDWRNRAAAGFFPVQSTCRQLVRCLHPWRCTKYSILIQGSCCSSDGNPELSIFYVVPCEIRLEMCRGWPDGIYDITSLRVRSLPKHQRAGVLSFGRDSRPSVVVLCVCPRSKPYRVAPLPG